MKQQALMERYPDVQATFERYEQGKDESDVCVCTRACVHVLACVFNLQKEDDIHTYHKQ